MKGPFIIAALYRFVRIEDPESLRLDLQRMLEKNQVRGTLLVASEGINGTLAGTRTGIDQVLDGLRSDPRFEGLEHKESTSQEMPFRRTKVRLKKEIVSLGVDKVDPTSEVGTYVEPSEWNELISDPDVILIDTRNDYEVDLGTFRGAENPETGSFREFPSYIESRFNKGERPRVAMFCTGGIRCEKATSFLRGQGFDEVYHLKGGILKYLEEVDPKESLWEGECFVFDDRVAVDHDLQPGSWDLCHACRRPISEADRSSPEYEPGVQCPHCTQERTDEERERFRERQRQVELAARRGRSHLGDDARSQHLLDRLRKKAEKERQKTHLPGA